MSLSLSKQCVERVKNRGLLGSEDLCRSLPFLSFTFTACCCSEQGIDRCLNKNAIFLIRGRNYVIICRILSLNSIGNLHRGKNQDPVQTQMEKAISHKCPCRPETFPQHWSIKIHIPFCKKRWQKSCFLPQAENWVSMIFLKFVILMRHLKKVINMKDYFSNYNNLSYSFRINFVEHFSCDLLHYLFI